jgi:DNA-binding NarL/FixJ family response regulator
MLSALFDEKPNPGKKSPPPTPLKVALIEDRREIRQGLALLIDGTDGYQCRARLRSMEEALATIRPPLPDVVRVDIGLPGLSGIEGIRRLKACYPNRPLLVLTVYDDDERIFEALCAGACGYLLKKTPPARLLEGLKEVTQGGGAAMSPEIAHKVIRLFRAVRPPEQAAHQLTAQEVRLLKLLIEGHSYKTAAAEMNVSVNTISFHLRHVYHKLQVHSKSEAVAKALRNGLVK